MVLWGALRFLCAFSRLFGLMVAACVPGRTGKGLELRLPRCADTAAPCANDNRPAGMRALSLLYLFFSGSI